MGLHGIQIKRTTISPPPIALLGDGVVGVVGTAPGATIDGAFGDGTNIIYDQPFRINNRAEAPTADLGDTGSLPKALNGIFRQGNVPVQMVIVQHEPTINTTARVLAERQHFVGGSADLTGMWALTVADPAPTILCIGDEVSNRRLPTIHNARGFTMYVEQNAPTGTFVFSSPPENRVITKGTSVSITLPLVTGATSYTLSQLHKFPGLTFDSGTRVLSGTTNVDVPPTFLVYQARRASGTPLFRNSYFTMQTVPSTDPNDISFGALPVNFALEVGTAMTDTTLPTVTSSSSTTLSTMIQNLPPGISYNTSTRVLSGTPTGTWQARALLYEAQGDDHSANTVAAELVTVAGVLGAIAVLDGPDGTQAEAITKAGDFDSPRAYLVDPGVVTADGRVLSSPSVAGLMAATPFWESPSNRILQGVVGLGRLIDRARAQALNDDYIATVIRRNGFRLWGNETLATTGASYRFVNIQRTADAIEASLVESHLYAVDRNITVRYFETVALGVNNFLSKLTAQGAITGGICYPDDAKNTVASIQAGEVYFQIEWSGSYPAQTLNINIELSGRFLEELLANI